MGTGSFPTTSEFFAKYLTFLVEFSLNPRNALRPYAQKDKIDGTLLGFFALGLAVSHVIVLIVCPLKSSDAPAICGDEGAFSIAGPITSLPFWAIPIFTAFLILASSIMFHLTALVATQMVRKWVPREDSYLGGTIWDSVNAAFGFSGFYIPFLFLLLSILTWKRMPTDSIWLVLLGVVIIYGFFFTYFAAALSATHPKTTFLQAFRTLIIAMLFFGWYFVVGRKYFG